MLRSSIFTNVLLAIEPGREQEFVNHLVSKLPRLYGRLHRDVEYLLKESQGGRFMYLKNVSSDSLPKKISLVAALLLLMAASVSYALGQQNRNSPDGRDALMADLMKLPGKLLGEGRNTQPVGPLKLTKYRVEELSLEQSIKVELGGRTVQVDKAWRVTVVGGPFPVRALPPVIWIDDVPLGYAAENERLSEISVITFDRSLLRQGAAIALSYGDSKDARMELPEKLSLIGTR